MVQASRGYAGTSLPVVAALRAGSHGQNENLPRNEPCWCIKRLIYVQRYRSGQAASTGTILLDTVFFEEWPQSIQQVGLFGLGFDHAYLRTFLHEFH